MEDSFDPPSVILSTVDNEIDNIDNIGNIGNVSVIEIPNSESLSEVHASDCSTCVETDNISNECDEDEEYVWEDYSKYNNCRTGDCTECIQQLLVSGGHYDTSFQQEHTSDSAGQRCDKCESAYECVCDMLIAHGHCSTCLYQGGDCVCSAKNNTE